MALATLLLAASLAGCSSDPGSETTGTPSISSSLTTENATADPVVNGRILSETVHLARARRACNGCDIPGRASFDAFDTAAGRVFFWWDKPFRAFNVVGPDGERTRVTCGEAFACPRTGYGINARIVAGPGPDEFSLWGPDYFRLTADQKVQVIGFDGTVRRTINLADRLPRDARVYHLAWSPDGTRLAVTTKPTRGTARANADVRPPRRGGRRDRIWLIEGEDDPQLVHIASSYTGRVPARYQGRSVRGPGKHLVGHIYGTSWSPDGSRLGFAEHYGPTSRSGTLTWYSFATQISSLLLPEAGQEGPGSTTMLHEYRGFPGGGNMDVVVWSPDGTRVAFRKWRRAFELSAEDGTVLARHPIKDYGLVWRPKQP